jgi:hypothetical protein
MSGKSPSRRVRTNRNGRDGQPEGFVPGAFPVPPFYPSEREAREIFASSTDAVSAVIRRVRVRGIILRLCRFSAPWGLCMNAPTGGFFAVRTGTLHASTNGTAHERLGAGDVVVFFRAGKHLVADPPGASATPRRGVHRQRA